MSACHTYIGVLDCLGIRGTFAFNSGSTRPIKVLAPSGTIVNADYPVAIAGGTGDVGYRIAAAVIGALAQAVPPEHIKADCQGTAALSTTAGINPETKQQFICHLYWGGGTGARVTADGMNGMQPFATNNKNHIVEVIERTCPILFEAYSFVTDTPGPGYNKGGVGTRIAWTLRAPEASLATYADRHTFSPYGVYGGLPPNALSCGHYSDTRLRLAGEKTFKHFPELYRTRSFSKVSGLTLHEGDTYETITTGGGGYGDPLTREPERVLSDVKNEYVSVNAAKESYGVVISGTRPEDLKVDESATKQLRDEMRRKRLM